MTWLLIDPAAVARFERINQQIVNDEPRRYYCTRLADERRALAVCRHDLRLEDLAGLVVDAGLGWEDGTAGFVQPGDELLLHTKVTIYAILHEHRGLARRSLSHVLDDAPLRCAP
jgi:hypothetical protein